MAAVKEAIPEWAYIHDVCNALWESEHGPDWQLVSDKTLNVQERPSLSGMQMPLAAKIARHSHAVSHVSVADRHLVRMSWQDGEAADNARTMAGHPDFVEACRFSLVAVLNAECHIKFDDQESPVLS